MGADRMTLRGSAETDRVASQSRPAASETAGEAEAGSAGSGPSADVRAGRTVSTYRPDVDGLRALAVVLVVGFHAGLPWLDGGFIGVDVFFVISGFLITGLLVDEIHRSGRVRLANFYARRARRLLPMASLVLVATLVATWLLVPPLGHGGVVADVRAAALWYANWHFAAESTQYMSEAGQSPVLHYWSLSVEEQFYVVWPLLLLAVAGRGLATRNWPAARRRIGWSLAVLGGASLLCSIWLTPTSGSWAYFGLHTRAWELAAGAALALARPAFGSLRRRYVGVAGPLGIVLVVASAIAYDRLTPFPGVAAILPVVGTMLLIVAGAQGAATGVPYFLSRQPVVRLGEVSYGWYLWHWPCLILAAVWVGEGSADAGVERTAATELAWPVAATAVAVSLALAMITHAIFENPIRRSRWLAAVPARSLAIGLVFVLLPLAAGAYLDRSSNDLMDDITTATPPPPEDASADGPVVGRPTGKLIMTPKQAALDKLPETRCMGGIGTTTAPVDCRWGDRRGERVVVLVGDSHAQHWMPAMEKAAEANHWQLFHWSKSACSMADLPIYSTALKRRYRECERWRADVIKRIDELPRADLVVMARSAGYLPLDESGDIAAKSDFGDLWQRGAERTFAALTPLAERVVVMEDVPWAASPVPECLSQHLDDIDKCDFPLKGNGEHDQLQTEREKAAAGAGDAVQFLDMTRYVCPTATCPVVDGDGVVIYRDQSHMTTTFNAALWRPLTRELIARMDDPPGG